MRITLAQLKAAADWSQVSNLCTSDSRWLLYLNQALARLVNAGMWVGTTQLYRFCTQSACITIPRQFQTFEVVDVNKTPYQVRNQWFEFLENGPGMTRLNGCNTTTGNCSGMNVIDRGRGYAGFGDITHTRSKIRLYPTLGADAGKQITIRGYDESGNWVLTNSGNTEGEVLSLAFPYVESTTVWGRQAFRQVLKAVTKGFVRAYCYDADDTSADPTLCALAIWEPGETLPDYRRYIIPSLEGSTTDQNVDVIARLQHIDITSDLDFLPIGNVSAIKLAMLSIIKEERGDLDGARVAMYGTFDPIRRRFIGGATNILEEELDSYQGAGTVAPLRITNLGRPGVVNLI